MSSARLFSPPISHPIADDVVAMRSVNGDVKLTFLYGDKDGSSALLFLSAAQADALALLITNKQVIG